MAVERRQTTPALVRAEFVGRQLELATLTTSLAETLSGEPRIVLCRGEAGIGKTRLAEELLTQARMQGALGVWGAADESVGLPPYWPWSQVFRAIAHKLDLRHLAAQHGLTLEVAHVAPDVFAPAEAGEASAGSMDDRVRQFDAVAQILGLICQQVPLVIILEDVHWADEPSLLLLGHVVRGLTDERMLIIVNARDLEHGSGERLSRLLRQPIARLLELGGLTEPEVRRLLSSLLGRPVGDGEVARSWKTCCPEHESDPRARTLDVVMLMVTGGRERSAAQFGELLQSADFRLTTVIETAGPMRIVEGVAV